MRLLFVILVLFYPLVASAQILTSPSDQKGIQRPTTQHDIFSSRIRIGCMNLKGLEKNMRSVTNEMQVYNNDQKTWNSKAGCSSSYFDRVITVDPQVATSAGVFKGSTVGFYGWLVSDEWLVMIERFAYTGEIHGSDETRAKDIAWRPAGIFSRKDNFLPNFCYERKLEIQGVEIIGHQIITGHPSDELAFAYCKSPIRGKAENYPSIFCLEKHHGHKKQKVGGKLHGIEEG